MGHSHDHEGHSHGGGGHSHAAGSQNRLALIAALVLNAAYTIVEGVGGLLTGSLALLADAGHMLSDVGALALALFAAWLAARPATPNRSFGFKRAEILAALFNAVTLVAISIWIFIEAYRRLQSPPEILGGWMLLIAFVGLLVNVGSAVVLSRGQGENLNMQGAFRHMLADAAGSVGVLLAAGVILLTGWVYADPLISAAIGVLILGSSWGLLRDSVNVLLEGAPSGLDANDVGTKMVALEGVEEVHDLHVWEITSGFPALAAHVLVGENQDCHERRREIEKALYKEFGIEHTTLQVDHVGDHDAKGPRLQFLRRVEKRDDER
jgi:cobalt-zinc-cadmium efflux system protein